MTDDKDCGNHQGNRWWKLLNRHTKVIIISSLIFLSIILFVILLIFLILRPSKPCFTLQDVNLYTFNLTTTLTSYLQITISSRNPNLRIGIEYDKVDVYASYRNQQITLPTRLPPTYQGHKEVTVWSPYLNGTEVPMAPYLAMSLAEDETSRTVLINVRATGRVRWKVGTFVSGRYRLNVNCPAYIMFENNNVDGSAVKYQFVEGCHVEV
ncbi:putative Late embryogenesis abundant protein [Helianthus annuus]|nr:putative Late embryogenesis abundant protein [Helianthus annuus]KAJ0609768.1 putative Late embryogenesis abundant protein [Helianthus annuus]KAJ0775543.1 putative Late embryogenesis abundant protein [Helianthus annuus]KAJ0818914.1 putative Late embryogenesis abundant protein [Helianthus annuus]KAJ0937746.1 putative Late embryogenesis abundant protein [Helianthus annuus]